MREQAARKSAPPVEAPGKLVIFAPNWLGDAILALPLIADIQRAWPDTEIAVAARRSVVALFEMVPGINHTITLEGSGGLRALGALRRNARLLAASSFDAALLLPNSFQSAWLASRAKIPERWGFARDLRRTLLTRVIKRPSREAHQAEYYQALATGLGVSVGDRFAGLVVADDDKRRAGALLRESGLAVDKRFVICAPGAAYGKAKQWPPERFAELAALLERDRLIATVLVGAHTDMPACGEVLDLSRKAGAATVVDLSGRTDLATLAGLATLAHAVVANDSGAMHLAAAVGAPVVAVFGPTDDRKTSPLRAGPQAPTPQILSTSVWCRPCMLRECPIDHRCMTGISARAVFAKL